jgi:hypothetical protein
MRSVVIGLSILIIGMFAETPPADAACNYIQCIGPCITGSFADGCGPRRAFCAAQCSGPSVARKYGAIAYSPGSGSYGYSDNYGSRAEAESRALNQCGKDDCVIATWFVNNCGALAAGTDHAWAGEIAASEERAKILAQASCRGRSGGNCEVLVSHCSG